MIAEPATYLKNDGRRESLPLFLILTTLAATKIEKTTSCAAAQRSMMVVWDVPLAFPASDYHEDRERGR